MVAKHAKQEPLNVLTVGDSAIAMLVQGCAEPFAVLPMGTILAQLPKRQVSSTNDRALVTKLCIENRQTMMSHKIFSNVVHMTSKTFMQNMYRLGSACINLDHGAFRHCIQSLALRSEVRRGAAGGTSREAEEEQQWKEQENITRRRREKEATGRAAYQKKVERRVSGVRGRRVQEEEEEQNDGATS